MLARGFLVEIIRRTSSAVLFWAGELGGGVGAAVVVMVCFGGQGFVVYRKEREWNLAAGPRSHMGCVS